MSEEDADLAAYVGVCTICIYTTYICGCMEAFSFMPEHQALLGFSMPGPHQCRLCRCIGAFPRGQDSACPVKWAAARMKLSSSMLSQLGMCRCMGVFLQRPGQRRPCCSTPPARGAMCWWLPTPSAWASTWASGAPYLHRAQDSWSPSRVN